MVTDIQRISSARLAALVEAGETLMGRVDQACDYVCRDK
jgi:hypothetical protein